MPCREEMPQLNALQAQLGGEDFQVVAINIDRGGADKADKFLEETKATDIALYTDPSGKLFSSLKAVGMPTTLLISPDGKEMGRFVGPADWASPEAKRLIEAAMLSKLRVEPLECFEVLALVGVIERLAEIEILQIGSRRLLHRQHRGQCDTRHQVQRAMH